MGSWLMVGMMNTLGRQQRSLLPGIYSLGISATVVQVLATTRDADVRRKELTTTTDTKGNTAGTNFTMIAANQDVSPRLLIKESYYY